jgi:hypothetical protein
MVMLDNLGDRWQSSKLWSLPNGGSMMLMQHSPTTRVEVIGVLRTGDRHTGDISSVSVSC